MASRDGTVGVGLRGPRDGLFLLGCDDTVFGPEASTPGPVDDPSPPTWYTDVLPIVEENCVSCHTAGGIAPFALDSFAAAGLMAESM